MEKEKKNKRKMKIFIDKKVIYGRKVNIFFYHHQTITISCPISHLKKPNEKSPY